MGFFNFLETFFFISLAITFILILLLVYHFKQRLTSLEEKGDTMFEIINNIVKEISSLKQAFVQRNTMFPAMVPMSQMPSMFTMPSPSVIVNSRSVDYAEPPQGAIESSFDDMQEEDEEEEDEEDEDEEEEADEDEGDENEEEEEEHQNIKIVKIDDSILTPVELEILHENDEQESQEQESQEQESQEQESQEQDEQEQDEQEQDEQEQLDEIVDEQLDEIVDEQLDEIVDEQLDEIVDETPIDKESYRKMTIQQLKTIVISRGLSKDVNKLKKNELLALLE